MDSKQEKITALAEQLNELTKDYSYEEILTALATYFLAISSNLIKEDIDSLEKLNLLTIKFKNSFPGFLLSISQSFISAAGNLNNMNKD